MSVAQMLQFNTQEISLDCYGKVFAYVCANEMWLVYLNLHLLWLVEGASTNVYNRNLSGFNRRDLFCTNASRTEKKSES